MCFFNHLGRISHLEEQVEEARLERIKLIGTSSCEYFVFLMILLILRPDISSGKTTKRNRTGEHKTVSVSEEEKEEES